MCVWFNHTRAFSLMLLAEASDWKIFGSCSHSFHRRLIKTKLNGSFIAKTQVYLCYFVSRILYLVVFLISASIQQEEKIDLIRRDSWSNTTTQFLTLNMQIRRNFFVIKRNLLWESFLLVSSDLFMNSEEAISQTSESMTLEKWRRTINWHLLNQLNHHHHPWFLRDDP